MAYRATISPPEKGSFPLDHFGECQVYVDVYKQCLANNTNLSARCHHLAKDYLKCRMDKDLMAKEDLDTLGFKKKPVEPEPGELDSIGEYKPITRERIAGIRKVRRDGSDNVY